MADDFLQSDVILGEKKIEGPLELQSFSDVDWASDKATRQSTSGHCTFLGNTPYPGVSKSNTRWPAPQQKLSTGQLQRLFLKSYGSVDFCYISIFVLLLPQVYIVIACLPSHLQTIWSSTPERNIYKMTITLFVTIFIRK
ncbi:hypothetical protein KFK09_002317 [Dendrobium nobile]|uniref:Uncharacterized protein n=1 Tax=Dendrobium nobile TaxID=94219 RepID=A0A8T3CBX0_DENNO|nr:hypothetical protein KFK09_002317 [Dendrobium nobile]